MKETRREFIYKYWERTEFGREMIASGMVTEDEMYFLIPNNVKRMHGFPVTRTYGRRKSKYKGVRRKQIMTFKVFPIIEQIVKDILPKKIANSFNAFVDFRSVPLGDKAVFCIT
mgnify:CR=1 FL=1